MQDRTSGSPRSHLTQTGQHVSGLFGHSCLNLQMLCTILLLTLSMFLAMLRHVGKELFCVVSLEGLINGKNAAPGLQEGPVALKCSPFGQLPPLPTGGKAWQCNWAHGCNGIP